ncbi:hypothetical protein PENSPDRAFT_200341 [Peniophora sp. CONT]|nr:hypothetical protein PENSPDRAFT_200341 [Peniophora sp. CONT]
MHILSFPPELTVEFFFHLVLSDPPSVPLEGRPLGWINITFVCKYWRSQAIGCPGLWTDVSGELGPSWLNAFLERSQESPLVLRNFNNKGILSDLEHVLPEALHRIRALSIEKQPPVSIGAWLVSRPAPEMQHCALTRVKFSTSFRGSGTQGTPNDSAVELFAANAPQLRTLSLREPESFPWNSVVLSGLVTLNFSRMIMKASETMDVILALRNMHHLESLVFHNLFYQVAESNTHTVELAHLKHLDIGADHSFFHYVYRHILHPGTTRLKATCTIRNPTHMKANIDAILALFTAHPTRRSPDAYKTIAICFDSDVSVLTEAWEEEISVTDTSPPAALLTLSFQLFWPGILIDVANLEAIAENVIGTLSFPNTRALRLKSSSVSGVISTALTRLPSSVSTLSFTYNTKDDLSNIGNVLTYLATAMRTRENGRREHILPKIQTLSFAHKRYGLMSCAMDHHTAEPHLRLLDILRNFAVSRQRSGAGLRAIYVHPSTLRSDSISKPVHIPLELEHLIIEYAS